MKNGSFVCSSHHQRIWIFRAFAVRGPGFATDEKRSIQRPTFAPSDDRIERTTMKIGKAVSAATSMAGKGLKRTGRTSAPSSSSKGCNGTSGSSRSASSLRTSTRTSNSAGRSSSQSFTTSSTKTLLQHQRQQIARTAIMFHSSLTLANAIMFGAQSDAGLACCYGTNEDDDGT